MAWKRRQRVQKPSDRAPKENIFREPSSSEQRGQHRNSGKASCGSPGGVQEPGRCTKGLPRNLGDPVVSRESKRHRAPKAGAGSPGMLERC
jgi:hypothetical protein